jgi:gluconate 5-dehydrogenase
MNAKAEKKPMLDMFSLKGKVAVVTGASRGIGRALADALAQAGAKVVLAARDVPKLKEAVDAIRKAGGDAEYIAFELQDTAAGVAAIADVVKRHGRLDILVNNAGINVWKPFLESTEEDWHRVLDTNLTSTYVLAREALKPMVAQGWGRVINVGSALSVIGREKTSSYVASKHAIAGLTKSIAGEFGSRNITCNCIAPGYFMTEINTALLAKPGFAQTVSNRTTVGRWGEPQEMAGAIVFLASEASSYVNGHVLLVDGGITAAYVSPPGV